MQWNNCFTRSHFSLSLSKWLIINKTGFAFCCDMLFSLQFDNGFPWCSSTQCTRCAGGASQQLIWYSFCFVLHKVKWIFLWFWQSAIVIWRCLNWMSQLKIAVCLCFVCFFSTYVCCQEWRMFSRICSIFSLISCNKKERISVFYSVQTEHNWSRDTVCHSRWHVNGMEKSFLFFTRYLGFA